MISRLPVVSPVTVFISPTGHAPPTTIHLRHRSSTCASGTLVGHGVSVVADPVLFRGPRGHYCPHKTRVLWFDGA